MSDKLKQISQNAGLMDYFEKEPKFVTVSVNTETADDANNTPVELCVAQTLSSWREMEQKPPEPSQVDERDSRLQDLGKAKSEEFHSDTNSSPIVASESTSISPISPHNDLKFIGQGPSANCPDEFLNTSYSAVGSVVMVSVNPETSNDRNGAPHFQQISVLTNDQQARLICQNGRFSSFLEFITAFDAWRQTFFHPFRVASSEALREPNNGAVDETFKYRYIVYHCAFYGNPRKRGNGKRPNQNYMPCGCEAMLRLNFNHNEHCLKITTLRDAHKGHILSADSFRRISTKIRRISPTGSSHSGGEISPSSLRNDMPQAVKLQLNSPNTSAFSIGHKDVNDTPPNSMIYPSDSKSQRRPYRQRKSIKSIDQKPQNHENSALNSYDQQHFQEGQSLQDQFQRVSGFQGQANLGYGVQPPSSASAAESIELSLMAAASAMSVKASSVTGPLSSSSKSSQSYSSDSRLLLHSLTGPASQNHDIYSSSASSGSSIMSASGISKTGQDQRQLIGHNNSGYLYQQPPYAQVHLEMPQASGGSAASSASFSTNLLSPHTPSSFSTDDVNNINKFDKDLTTSLLLSLLEESNRSSRLTAGQFLGGDSGGDGNGTGVLSSSALLNLIVSQTPANVNFGSSSGSAPYFQPSKLPTTISLSSGLQSQPLHNSETSSNLERRQQEILSAIFSKIINQAPQTQPQVTIEPTTGLSTFGSNQVSNRLLSFSSGIKSTEDNAGLNSSAISANCQLPNVSDSDSVKNTVAKVQEILSNPAYANVSPNVLALMLSTIAGQPPATIQLGSTPLPQPLNDSELFLLHNPQFHNFQNDRLIESTHRQPPYCNPQESLVQQLLTLQEKVRQNKNKCLGQLPSSTSHLVSSGQTTIAAHSLVNSNQVCADGERILQRLRDHLYAVEEPSVFVSNLQRLSEFLVTTNKS